MSTARPVLVVEDDATIASFLKQALEAMGHEVIHAADGQEGLLRAAHCEPALVLLDALLPKVDGFQVLRELRSRAPQVPVVLMSGVYTKRSYQQEALDLGARGYLIKPVSMLRLWELAEQHLGPPADGSWESGPTAGTPLREKPLPQVLCELLARQATGMLFVRGPAGTSILFLEDGRLVFGRSSDQQTRLDRILEASGRLSGPAVLRARELLSKAKGRARLGELLVQEGLLSAAELQEALAQQQRLHVTRPLTWTEGACRFFESEAPRQEAFKLRLDMDALLVWAARHVPAGPALEAWQGSSERLLKAKTELPALGARLGLTSREQELLALADGTRSASVLRAIGRLAQVDTERLLPVLVSTGWLQASAPDGPVPPRKQLPKGFEAPVAGDLKSHAPARLLLQVALGGQTGMLRFERRRGETEEQRTVYFEEGRVAFASSSDPQDRLGQVLLRAGFVDAEQLRLALAAGRATPGTGLGRILLDQHALQLDDLHRALVKQVEDVTRKLVEWTDGDFRFRQGPLPTTEIVPLRLPATPLLLRSLRECSFTALAPRLPREEAVLSKTWHCFELAGELELNELEDRVLLSLEERPRVSELLGTTAGGAQAEEILRALHLFLVLGLVEEGTAKPAEAQPEPTQPRIGVPLAGLVAAPGASIRPELAGSSGEDWGNESFGPAGLLAMRGGPEPEASSGALQGFGDADTLGLDTPLPESAEATEDATALDGVVPSGSGAAEPVADGFSFGDLFDTTGLGRGVAASGMDAPSRGAVQPDRRTAAALLEAEAWPDADTGVLLAVHDFLSSLGEHLSVHPESLPEEILATLPAELRDRFGLRPRGRR